MIKLVLQPLKQRQKRGSANFNCDIPSFCEIRDLAILNPLYT